jgi:UDP-N-acetyl-D-galactosamine dehydrogenase
MTFSNQAADLSDVRFYIIAVPTPVDTAKRPDFTPLIGASTLVGRQLAKGSVVVYESTVYPGATEEICVPVLERESGLRAGVDFSFGYSPERINPGDKEHTVDKICKVVSGSDAVTCDVVAAVYGAAITAGVYRAASVKVAEAAKVIENTQRDLNIALMNELALIFHRLDIDTQDVLAAAGTKWNFLPFKPGLVGGHCIGVDPYYLTHKAEEVGYHPQVILAGRRINDGMGAFIAQECVRLLAHQGKPIKGARVLVLGLTFKEDCPDVRNTKVVDILAELVRFGCLPLVMDPVADKKEALCEYGIELISADSLPPCSAIIVAVAHRQFKELKPKELNAACPGGPILDVKAVFDRAALAASGLEFWRL